MRLPSKWRRWHLQAETLEAYLRGKELHAPMLRDDRKTLLQFRCADDMRGRRHN
jgi:hypothetical protein